MTEHETVRLTADVVLLANKDDELHVLLIQRRWDPFEGRWALPGGHVDPGEDTKHAARRELAEETGLHINTLERVGAYATPGRDPRGRYVTFAYTATLHGVLPRPTAGDDAAEARWFPVDTVLNRPETLAFDHQLIIIDTVAGVRVGAR